MSTGEGKNALSDGCERLPAFLGSWDFMLCLVHMGVKLSSSEAR